MTRYDVAFIGTGPEPENPVWGVSAAMAYQHAPGYRDHGACDIVACADLVPENAGAFATEFGIDDDHVYEDYEAMLREVEPDIVSISTPVPTHAPIVLGCLRSGVLSAIHCEKPMATTWGDARLIAQEADRRDVQLTFNHQRRFAPHWREPKRLLDDGEIGELERVEVATAELLDNGTHYVDLANMYNDERLASWVIGQLDYREEHVKYGAHNTNQTTALWEYENGVHGLVITGHGTDAVGCTVRLLGTDGEIQVNPPGEASYRIRRAGDADWEPVTHEGPDSVVAPAIEHLVDCLIEGSEPEISARRALSVTEIIFAVYESSRRRGRVDMPLDVEDNPLEAMVESGELSPTPAED